MTTSDDSNEKEPIPWTLGDVYEMGDDATRRRIEDMQVMSDELESMIDQDRLLLVRTGGHEVRVSESHGACQVQVENHRAGPTYGLWNFRHSPEGHEVRIEQAMPTSYRPDGGFDTCTGQRSWTVPAVAWRLDPASCIQDLVGKKIAAEVGPLLHLPVDIAPDARIRGNTEGQG